jgi:hypothetical protein
MITSEHQSLGPQETMYVRARNWLVNRDVLVIMEGVYTITCTRISCDIRDMLCVYQIALLKQCLCTSCSSRHMFSTYRFKYVYMDMINGHSDFLKTPDISFSVTLNYGYLIRNNEYHIRNTSFIAISRGPDMLHVIRMVIEHEWWYCYDTAALTLSPGVRLINNVPQLMII